MPAPNIYSLGVVLYELLTGERPFRGDRRMLLLQVLSEEPTPPRQLAHKVARDVETICLKAMARSPARSYAATWPTTSGASWRASRSTPGRSGGRSGCGA